MIATETISLRVKLGGAIATDNSPITGHYVTMSSAGVVIGVQAIHSVTNGVTPVVITPNALSGYVNVLKNLQVSNADSVTATVILEQWDGTTARQMSSSPLLVNQFLTLDSDGKITLSASGGITGTGTVTQVQGNGTVNGLSLSGNVTTSGNLTLSGNIPIANATTTGLLTSTDWVSFNSSSGLPVGGTTGQILGKLSATDGDAGWTQSIKGNATISSSGTATDNKLTVQNDGTSDGNCSIVLRRNDADQGAITAIPGNGGLVLSHNHASGKIIFQTGVNLTEKMRIDYLGRFGIGIDTPTSFLHLKAGTTTANTSPMKFEDGVLMTTPEHGAVEFDGSNIWTTISGVRAKNIFSSNNLSALSATTSAQLAGVISDETGTGSLVFGTNCTLNTPNLTTPSAINLTNAVSLNLTSGVSSKLPIANGGVPVGGTAGQVLAKIDGADNNVQWTTAASGSSAIGKNYLHNSNFAINQLGLSGTVTLTANSKDAHDRFKAGASGCTYTFATVAGKTTFTISAGNLIQTVNALDLPSGTNTMCLSFGGTSTGKIGAGTAGASGVTGSVVGGTNLDITFSTGTLWEVKLEKGSTPTAYEQPSLADEWANCLLYFEVKTPLTAGTMIATGFASSYIQSAGNTTKCYFALNFTRKASVPIITMPINSNNNTGWLVNDSATLNSIVSLLSSYTAARDFANITVAASHSIVAGTALSLICGSVNIPTTAIKIDARL